MITIDNGSGKQIIGEGKHIAILYQIVDMGTQKWFEGKMQRQFKLTFELPEVTKEFNGVKRPLVIGEDVNIYFEPNWALADRTLHEKGKLRNMVYEAFDVKIDKSFSLDSILGKACKINVIHKIVLRELFQREAFFSN